MIDIKFIRENPDVIKNACLVKGFDDYTDEIINLDKKIRELKTITQIKIAEKNKISAQIATATNRGPLIEKSKQITTELESDLEILSTLESRFKDLMHLVPQIPSTDSPVGPDDTFNAELEKVGTIRDFGFTPLPHWDILDKNNWWAPEKIADVSGSRTYCLKGEIAELDLAIQTFIIQKLIAKGFTYIQVPAITKPESVFDAGHFKGSDLSVMNNDVFMLTDTDRCLAGTAEIVLNSMHKNEIISQNDLPIMYAGWSPCFRKEAGAAGRDTRGLVRVHQFHKVEQFIFCEPEKSEEMHQLLLDILKEVMADLEMPYRTLAVSTGDMGFNKVKQHDIDAFMPGQNRYIELGSCSSIGEFQSRRTNTRYRENGTNDVKYCATLNNTAMALPRSLAAVIENHQNEDASVNIPKKLQFLMGGRTKIGGTNK